MLVYTSNSSNAKRLKRVEELGMGIMLHSLPGHYPSKTVKHLPCALDNGAFSCWLRGYPFMADCFERAVHKAYESGLKLNFLVCPDIVGGGKKSLDFSMEWATGKLRTAPRLALAVQDGMEPKDISHYHRKHFTHIFVGGTKKWKWDTAEEWCSFAHEHGKECHIGRVGSLDLLRAAERFGADSTDSTVFDMNGSWHIMEEFLKPKQGVLIA